MSRHKLLSAGKNLFQTYRKPAVIIGCTCSCFYIGRRLMSNSNRKGPNEAPNMESMRVTRRGVETIQNNARESYLNKSLDEKRKLYKCGNKYVLPSAVEDWATYAEKVVDKYDSKPKYDVNEGLNQIVCLWRGDITKLEIDGIVNAANGSLLGGGGVDGAIHAAAGPHLKEECRTLNGCSTGEAKITAGYNLPAKYVIHTVGPIGIKPDKLRNAYLNSLNLAVENGVKIIAFPCISTGIYGYDIEKATPVVLRTVREWLCDADNANKVHKIIFCVFLENDVEVYENNLLQYFPVQNDKPPPDKKVSPKKAKSTIAGEQKKNKSENKAPAKESSKSSVKVNSTEKAAGKEKEENKKGVTTADKENDTEEAPDKGNEENIKAGVNVDQQTEKPFKEKCESTDKLSQSKNGKLTDESDKKDTKEKSGSEEVDDQNQSEKKAKKVKSAEDVLAPAAKRKPVILSSKEHLRPPNAVL